LNPAIRIVGVEPYLGHGLQGLKNMKESYRPGIFDKSLPDAIVNVNDEEAFELTRRLAREEGLFVGMSSGAAMAAALAEAARLNEGRLVVILPDSGERYLSTGVFPDSQREEEEQRHALRLTNTLTRTKQAFEPLNPGKAGIYSCGPTAYEFAHLGLCRRVVVADLLRRTLESRSYDVTHVMNITDLDDKTIRAALEQGTGLTALTDHYARAFLDDVCTLNVKTATHYPRASAHVDDMIRCAQRLIETGYAYVKHGSVYFDISKLPSYGRLSRVDLSSIDVGRTVDLDDYEKDSPVDFTLFKRVTLDELKRGIGFETGWGQVRPGWHIECVAMAMKYLGDFFDIHTSGSDLIFPHHENEIAMATALTGRSLARNWLHSELVFVDGKKMSRSAGNVVTLRDLLAKGYTGRQVRFFLLRTHYRMPLNFSYDHLDDAAKALRRLDQFLAEIQAVASNDHVGGDLSSGVRATVEAMEADFYGAVSDDLNMSKALAALFGLIRQLNPSIASQTLSPHDAAHVVEALGRADTILAFLDIATLDSDLLHEVRRLISERDSARNAKDWEKADKIRKQIVALGIEVMDTPAGVRWRRIKD
jgi:cysteinyl-tRNA synthetase